MKHPRLHSRLQLPSHPDCVEMLRCSNMVAVGMYELREGRRQGGVQIVTVDRDEKNEEGIAEYCLYAKHRFLEDIGILDLSWFMQEAELLPPQLICITSDATVKRISILDDDISTACDIQASCEIKDNSNSSKMSIGTALDVLDSGADRGMIAAVTSDGFCTVWDRNFRKCSCWHSGDMTELWSVALGSTDSLLTGGDDATLKMWDRRCLTVPTSVNSKSHSMGITAIEMYDNIIPFTFLTGSYDEILRVWDLRNTRQPLTEEECCGGIWRIKWDPRTPRTLMIAAAHGGCEIWNVNDTGCLSKQCHYPCHESLVYGISSFNKNDIHNSFENNFHNSVGENAYLSCSFYDKEMHLWGVYDDGKI